MSNCSITGPRAEEHDDDARRMAQERRQQVRAKEAHWISVDRALEIEGTSDPTRLRMEIKRDLPCRFQSRQKWWCWKAIEEVAPLLAGRHPLDLQDARWELVIHKTMWRERIGKPGAPAPSAGTSVKHRDATDDEIRVAMRAIYDEKGDERPDSKKIVPLVLERLKAIGLCSKWRTVGQIAREREFEERRYRPGPRRKSPKNRPE
jgi:hypothetical protein